MIHFDTIHIGFNGKKVLNDFSLSLESGEKVLITGRSGIGKSTLFRLLLGFERPHQGLILFQGQPLSPEIVWQIRQQTAYVSQDVDLGSVTVRDFLTEILGYKANRTHHGDESALKEMLATLDLDESQMDDEIPTLSGGEKQRVSLLTALMLKRSLFLLDEPTAALDRNMKKKVADFFLSHPEWTVLVISHDSAWRQDGVRVIDMEAS